jgi:hypothetical protein
MTRAELQDEVQLIEERRGSLLISGTQWFDEMDIRRWFGRRLVEEG